MNHKDLEALIGRKLAELPAPAAPPTLAPRVLRAVRSRLRRSWYDRPWRSWPRVWQAASVAVLAAAVVGLAALEPAAQSAWTEALSGWTGPADRLRAVLAAAGLLQRVLLEQVVGYLVAFTFVMGAACAGLGAAVTRLASLGGASQS